MALIALTTTMELIAEMSLKACGFPSANCLPPGLERERYTVAEFGKEEEGRPREVAHLEDWSKEINLLWWFHNVEVVVFIGVEEVEERDQF